MNLTVLIQKDTRLTPAQRIILWEVAGLSKREEGCTAKNSHFINELGISERTLKRSLANLIKLGFVLTNGKTRGRVLRFQKDFYISKHPRISAKMTPIDDRISAKNDPNHIEEQYLLNYKECEEQLRAPDQKNKNLKIAIGGKPAKQDANLSAIAAKEDTAPQIPPAPPKFDFESAILAAWCSFYEENLKVRCNPPTGKRRISLFEVVSCVSDTLGLVNGSRTSESAVTGFKRFLNKLPDHRRTAKELNPAFILNDYSQILAEMKNPKGRNVLPVNERVSRSSASLMSKVKMY